MSIERRLFSLFIQAGVTRLSCNRVPMSLPDHANGVAGAINDNGKEVHDVPAKYTHIKRFGIRETSERPLKLDGGSTSDRQS
jgi:hypothetical protein